MIRAWLETDWSLLLSLFLGCFRRKCAAGELSAVCFSEYLGHCPAFSGLSDCLRCQKYALPKNVVTQPSPAWEITSPRRRIFDISAYFGQNSTLEAFILISVCMADASKFEKLFLFSFYNILCISGHKLYSHATNLKNLQKRVIITQITLLKHLNASHCCDPVWILRVSSFNNTVISFKRGCMQLLPACCTCSD